MTVLVTGATDGLGRALADRLAADGATLILHGRDPERFFDRTREARAHPQAYEAAARAELWRRSLALVGHDGRL